MSAETAVAVDEDQGAVNPLAMSDEDVMNMVAPSIPRIEEPAEPVAEQPQAEPQKAAEPQVQEPAAVAPSAEPQAAPSQAPAVADPVGDAAAEEPKADPVEAGPADYEGFYKQVMAPFKANGKTIELKTPEEAVQLMQMGANYTRKMQELVPVRKQLTMLQNNNIDEAKLSFLIDLDKKNPEAIKKLLKESGIDPLDIDTSSEPAYLEGNHQVSDEEVSFKAALEDLGSTPDGQVTLQVINAQWDQASKDVLWTSPETMATIHEQREYGIYDRIVAEMDRQKTLGSIPAGTPFLQAYKIVGDRLASANAFADLVAARSDSAPNAAAAPPVQATSSAPAVPVATRVVPPKPQVTNDSAASAAAATRATPAPAQVLVNPLSIPDEEFLKQFNGRL